jgi:hypothetical protein
VAVPDEGEDKKEREQGKSRLGYSTMKNTAFLSG